MTGAQAKPKGVTALVPYHTLGHQNSFNTDAIFESDLLHDENTLQRVLQQSAKDAGVEEKALLTIVRKPKRAHYENKYRIW